MTLQQIYDPKMFQELGPFSFHIVLYLYRFCCGVSICFKNQDTAVATPKLIQLKFENSNSKQILLAVCFSQA